MSSSMVQFKGLIEQLQSDEYRSTALNELKNLLTFDTNVDALSTLRHVGITKIMHCLNISDKKLIELTCAVLKICFDKFEVGDIIKIYTSHVMYLLRHEDDSVRRLAIDEISKTITTGTILPLPQYIDVYVAVGQMICDSDIGIANKAVLITSNLPVEVYSKVLEEMKISLECNSSSKCNAYEVVVNISSKSYELFILCIDQGYIEFMINELYSEDVLYQLNILELLTQLAITPHGINYLVKEGIFQKISDIVQDLHKNPFGGLLIPGYMKFFGSIAHYYPNEIFQKYPILSKCLFDAMDSDDITILPVALDTLGFIGTTIEGKMSLMALGSVYTQNVEKIGNIIKNSKTDLKTRALNCLANLISVSKDPSSSKIAPIDQRVTLMTREWFRSLSQQPEPIQLVFDICKNPFPDVRLAGLTLLDAVCQHRWGEEIVAGVAGLIEYLLDRTVDYTKESKEAKYDIIKKLSHSAAFDENIISRLQKYVEEGPFYTETETQVAMEGE